MVAINSIIIDENDVFLNKKNNKIVENDALTAKYHVFTAKEDVFVVKKDFFTVKNSVFPDISHFLPS